MTTMDDRVARLPLWAQHHIVALQRELREARAAVPCPYADPERMAIPAGSERITGWDFNLYSVRVFPCWTTNVVHWDDRQEMPTAATSGAKYGKSLYATRLDALIALRIALASEQAKQVAEVDRMIAEEQGR